MPFLVSVIIPCRNEEKFISRCLDSIIKQDFPREKLEVLVVDGISEDRTREIIKDYSQKFSFIKFLSNPKKFTPFAMNIGIKNSQGEIIMKMDAHATYQTDYISKSVKYLRDFKADGVGGILVALPRKNTFIAKAIALVLSNKFGSANSFKAGAEKPKWTDAVAFGCFKKEVFEKIGPYDEKMIRSQDMELNLRLKKAGGKILLVPGIIAYYYPQAKLKDFFRHNFIDGLWVTYPLRFGKMVFSSRHLIPFLFVLSLIGFGAFSFFSPSFFWLFIFTFILYFLINFYYSIKILANENNIRFLFLLSVAFAARHFGYGLGSIFGLIKIFLPKNYVKAFI